MAPPSVLVCTPAYAGQITVPYFESVMGVWDSYEGDVNFLVTRGESLITRARNNLVSTFMASHYDVLAFIDADIEFSAEDFNRLAVLDKDIRGAAVALKRPDGETTLSVWKDGKSPKRHEMSKDPFEVDFIGTAMMFISRKALETLIEKHPEQKYIDPMVGGGYGLFETVIASETYLSEDYGFCLMAKHAGLSVWCDPEVVVGHYGVGCWRE